MNKILFIILIGGFSMLSASGLIPAKDAHKTTIQETKKLEKHIMKSANGKKAYNGLIIFFNKNIARIASGGYYNSFIITYINAPNKISELLKPLSRKEQDVIRSLVIRELIKKGYSVTHNQYWDSKASINISVSW